MRSPRFLTHVLAGALAGLSACASLDLGHIAPTVIPKDAAITKCKQGMTPKLAESTDTVVSDARLARMALPAPLKDDPVIVQLTDAVTYQVVSGRRAALVALRQSTASADATLKGLNQGGKLSNSDFKHFARTLAATALNPVVVSKSGSAALGAAAPVAARAAQPTLIDYYNAYYKNEFYDRFGVAIAKPKNIRNISDDDIAGAVSIALEFLLDQSLKTPVWQDTAGNYYPGKFTDEPSVLKLNGLANATKLLDATQSMDCGITPLKAEAIAYLSKAAGDRATTLGGLTTGSFGGLHFGFGVLGKWSIGDNQTLQVIVKTALSRAFSRGAEEISYEVLENVGYQGDTISELLQYVLDQQKL